VEELNPTLRGTADCARRRRKYRDRGPTREGVGREFNKEAVHLIMLQVKLGGHAKKTATGGKRKNRIEVNKNKQRPIDLNETVTPPSDVLHKSKNFEKGLRGKEVSWCESGKSRARLSVELEEQRSRLKFRMRGKRGLGASLINHGVKLTGDRPGTSKGGKCSGNLGRKPAGGFKGNSKSINFIEKNDVAGTGHLCRADRKVGATVHKRLDLTRCAK